MSRLTRLCKHALITTCRYNPKLWWGGKSAKRLVPTCSVWKQRGNTRGSRWKESGRRKQQRWKSLSVLDICGRTGPPHDQELVFSCQRKPRASPAGQAATFDSPPRLIQSAVISLLCSVTQPPTHRQNNLDSLQWTPQEFNAAFSGFILNEQEYGQKLWLGDDNTLKAYPKTQRMKGWWDEYLTPCRPSAGDPSPGWWRSGSPPWRPRWGYEACVWEAGSDWLQGCPSPSGSPRRPPEDTPEPPSRSKETLGPSGCSSHRELMAREMRWKVIQFDSCRQLIIDKNI